MKTDDMNDTLRGGGDEAVRDRFDNQRRRYHHSESWPEPDMAVLRLRRGEAAKLRLEIFRRALGSMD